MQIKNDGQNYAPRGTVKPVCARGEFQVGIIGLDHGHIYGMSNGLSEAGASLTMVYDPSPEKVAEYCRRYPEVRAARCREEILENDRIKLIMSAAIPKERCEIGLEAMAHGKDYFVDKPPLITMEQLETAREAVDETGRKYAVYYSERRHVEAAVYAQKLIQEKAIGDVVAINGFGPHRASLNTRPAWFFDKSQYGGILTDIGSHQIEQMLIYAGAKDATIERSRVGNLKHKDYPGFEDYGDMMLTCDNGVVAYGRLDWFTPDGLGAWGDGRTFIIGTDGYLELRKYIDVANDRDGDHVYLVNHEGEHHIKAAGTVGFPFFGQLIRDCLDRTTNAFDQETEFKAIELAIRAENMAIKIG
ncbi:MAG: Gfo/Idh/MocA family protein [Lachnospiraceae bacterium]